jgi:GTP-binding protein LepA
MSSNHQQLIRNFCIIAHIDHGKSTLADRLLELTETISPREMRDQVLDTLALERERGITIKAQAVRMRYRARDGQTYQLNLIDTPGHVDFSYEVSRSLAACEGALLVVDAVQGVEAQTLANAYLAIDHNLEIIPVINKIDLPNADPEAVAHQIEEIVGLEASEAIQISAKLGTGTREVLEAIVRHIPPPRGNPESPLRALIFDSMYDCYRGVVTYVRIVDGALRSGDRIRFMSTQQTYEVAEVGYFAPKMTPIEELRAGEVGYVIAGVKTLAATRIGDTITHAQLPAHSPLAGYQMIKPVVFAGLYPQQSEDYEALKDAVSKLQLNDASFTVEPETSEALGFGFRCGFLGLLHMEVVQERLEREYGLELLITAPSVSYRVTKKSGDVLFVDNPSRVPSPNTLQQVEEPFVEARMFVPAAYLGPILQLLQNKKGVPSPRSGSKGLHYITHNRVMLTYELPLSEVITDFYDRLKSLSHGYASFDYELLGYRAADMVKLDILINGDPVDALSMIVHREDAATRGRALAEKLRALVPRQLFEVAIQAAIGGNIIARETVPALRKHVTAKCYGGDITRKRKLWEKQRAGKRRMKMVGKVEIPQEAFMALLKRE